MEQLGQTTLYFLRQCGYFAMLPLMVVEGTGVTIACGMMASLGIFFWPMVLVISILGDLISNVILYGIGYKWGRGFIRSWGKHFGINERRVLRMEKHFHRHSGKTLIVVKSMAGLYLLAFITAGILKMDFKNFLRFSLLGAIAWSSFLVAMGYFYGYLWKSIGQYVSWIGIVILIFMVGSFIVAGHYEKKHSEELLK